MSRTVAIERLSKAIGYPQEVPVEAGSFDFLVDGEMISAEAEVKKAGEGRILLKTVLTEDEEVAGRLATYAVGRLLKENAVLAWDFENRAAILWTELNTRRLSDGEVRRAFESFCESADWWRERVKESGVPGNAPDKFLIRP